MKEEVIDGKRVWTFDLKEFVGDDPLLQIEYERKMEWTSAFSSFTERIISSPTTVVPYSLKIISSIV